ncbi:hypothetical protein N7462_007894 [Penicillium macrosclerotiorum]|uniref:uncharacterized protein n=1 Tax=Penicillium macrosclerotiorum TaxID=303699 RepID=UPI0025487158|nr:uncharacterized protein N7462_007894 [Penicillium macrosclerotiorum]KAJ5679650.1 hypothetical protein N7462_007894 [Penicillium macrosclerotiorum]
MDSMRSLNTSLPSSTPRPQPPEQLLQSFKAAALSVTNLYKNAVCEQAQAKSAGYQEAIEDLLHFLDRENLGLGDGEGWKVRQWATEKCDGTASQASDDDERVDSDKRDRSATPATTSKEAPPSESTPRQPPTSVPTSIPPPSRSETTTPTPQSQETSFGAPTVFTFTAGPNFPQCQELDMDMQSSDHSAPTSQDGASPVSVSLMPRNPRSQLRHNNHSRPNARSATREPSASLGSKRKLTFPDFFDLSGMANGRDLFGGGKRGRFT